jgi:UDP-GlcNAc:undecaprenyl-phosphate GlcNAc-1-phosphate transferase
MKIEILDICYAALFAAGLIITVAATAFCKKLAVRLDIMDRPKNEMHKGHKKATPLLGGLAMFIGFSLTLAIVGALAKFVFALDCSKAVLRHFIFIYSVFDVTNKYFCLIFVLCQYNIVNI